MEPTPSIKAFFRKKTNPDRSTPTHAYRIALYINQSVTFAPANWFFDALSVGKWK